MSTQTQVTAIEIHTHEGVMCDAIEYRIGGGPMMSLPNNLENWRAFHQMNQSDMIEVVVVRTMWDKTATRTPWLESPIYLARRAKLEQ